jgi:hypothetical protein
LETRRRAFVDLLREEPTRIQTMDLEIELDKRYDYRCARGCLHRICSADVKERREYSCALCGDAAPYWTDPVVWELPHGLDMCYLRCVPCIARGNELCATSMKAISECFRARHEVNVRCFQFACVILPLCDLWPLLAHFLHRSRACCRFSPDATDPADRQVPLVLFEE